MHVLPNQLSAVCTNVRFQYNLRFELCRATPSILQKLIQCNTAYGRISRNDLFNMGKQKWTTVCRLIIMHELVSMLGLYAKLKQG